LAVTLAIDVVTGNGKVDHHEDADVFSNPDDSAQDDQRCELPRAGLLNESFCHRLRFLVQQPAFEVWIQDSVKLFQLDKFAEAI